MGNTSSIQWTNATWNVARGCTKVDEDCKYCYMYRDSFDGSRYNPLEILRTKTVFNLPLKLKEPSLIFTSSLTDFFHPAIDSYRNEAWDIIRKCPHHTFQILTKRPERILEHLPSDWGEGWDNVWLGTSVGSQKAADIRIPELVKIKAKVRFLSIEPMHEEVKLSKTCCAGCGCNTDERDCGCPAGTYDAFRYKTPKELRRGNWGVDWVIIGGESGNDKGKYKYRPCDLKWIDSLVTECRLADVSCFVKQLGTHLAKQMKLSDRHGGEMSEWPEHLQVRQMPYIHGTDARALEV